MKTGTHNLGANPMGKTTFVKTGEGGLRLLAGQDQVLLSAQQVELLKEVLA